MATSMRRTVLGSACALALLACASEARSEPDEPPYRRYFYQGRDYGSEALFGPASVFLNRGFDVLQLRPKTRDPFDQRYGPNLDNVGRSLADPLHTIEARGTERFIVQELFPLSFTTESARWAPNYGLHVIGGGVTYRALWEWFRGQGVPVPALFSALTLYGAATVNEALENKNFVGPNTDALADLYIFDLAGILLFSVDPVAEFFSTRLRVRDWSLQPALAAPRRELHNVGNYYAVKFPVPYVPRLELFSYVGFSTLGGLSLRVGRGLSVSAAGGVKIITLQNSDTTSLANVIASRPSGALFLDRNDSLLASLQVSDVSDYFVHANLYPNALFRSKPGVGFFAAASREAQWMAGVSFTGSLGLGVAVGTLRP